MIASLLHLVLVVLVGAAPSPVAAPPGENVLIEVRRADGDPAAGARVRVEGDSSEARSGLTGEDGRLALPREPGEELRLRVEAEATGAAPPVAVYRVVRIGRKDLPARLAAVDGGPGAEKGLQVVLLPGRPAYGRVLDARQQPLPGAEVVLRPTGEGLPAEARTGADGRFLVPAMPSGRFDLRAHAEGFAPTVVPGMEVEVEPGAGAVDLGTLTLRPGVRIEGRVTTAEGNPLESAEIRHRPAVGRPGPEERDRLRKAPPAAVTGPDGRFVIRDLAPGRPIHLLAWSEGFLSSWTLGVEAPSAEPLAVVLDPASSLAGRVVDEEGEALPDAEVFLRWTGPPPGVVGLEPRRGDGSRSAVTGRGGGFRFEELAGGEVELSARAPGFLPRDTAAVELPPGGHVGDVRLVLRRGAVVAGRIENVAGEAVAGAEVRAGVATARSDRTGAYRLAGVPPGVHGLFASHHEYRRLAQEIQVEPGVNEVDLVFEDGWTVAGRVVDEAGEAVAGARLVLRSDTLRDRTGYVATSGLDGRFRAVVSEEGRFGLLATREGFAPRRVQGLEVGPAPLEGVEVVLSRGASVVGQIHGLEPDDLTWTVVEAHEEALGTVAGTVDHRGRYGVHHLLPGDWEIRARVAGGRREARAIVVVEEGADRVERDLELGRGVRLTGRLSHGGEPVPGAHVSLDGVDVVAHRSVLTGHDGRFRLEGLEPGRYRLDVLDPARALSHLQDLEVSADADLTLDLESARLDGIVLDAETGEPVEDVLVYVRRILAGGAGSLVTVGTDAAGSFTLAHLALGSYHLTTHKDGYVPEERRVEVTAGAAPRRLVLRLGLAGGITVAVRTASGAVPALVTLSAFDPSGRKVLTDTKPVSDGGYAFFHKLPAGRWNVLVSSAGAAPEWAVAEVPGALDVVLEPAAPLTIRVPALLEAGAAGAASLATPGGEPFFQVEPGGAVRSQWALDGGRITLADVPAGTWTVQVTDTAGQVWTARVATDGQAPAAVTLE